jgi:deoxycytidine triphosphate deaminase
MKHIMGPNSQSKLTGVQPDDVQPNAVDVRLDKVFQLGGGLFTISEDGKQHRGNIELLADEDGWFFLEENQSYEVVMSNIIAVGEGEAGWVVSRSTLIRNGCFLTSGLYDSGYEGVIAACLHVRGGDMMVKRGTRIGQYLSFNSESLHLYDGDYGIAKDHDQKTYGDMT